MAMVSVIIPLYNKANLIARAIDSILAQTWQDFEIVIVDDGSTDNGPEIVNSYKDDRIHVVRQTNAGPGAARNRGVKESSSPYVAFLDGDDEYLPEFLHASMTNLKNNPDCVLCVANHYRGVEKIAATSIFPFNIGIVTGPWRLPPESETKVIWGSLIYLQSWVVVCRRDIILKFGGFYENRCTYGEDQYLWLQILLNHQMYRDTTPLFWYHTEDSELEIWARPTAAPILPFLSDPEPVRKNCPPEYRDALEQMFSYAASLNYSFMVADEKVVAFWREYLKGIPETHDLPPDHPRPRERVLKDVAISFVIDESVSARVRRLCEAKAIPPGIFFLACLAYLVWKHSAQETVVIGTPYADRKREEIQGLFGCFIRTIPVRFDVDSAMDLYSWFGYVKNQFNAAWAHTSIGPDELFELSAVPRTAGMNPIYQIAFAFQSRENRDDGDGLPVFGHTVSGRGVSENDLSLYIMENKRFEGSLVFSADLFDTDTMELFAANFGRTVRALSDGSNARLDRVELIDDTGRDLVKRINMTEVPAYLDRTFLDLFRESRRDFRDAAAIKTEDGTILTYRELDELSDGIARSLVSAGAKTGDLIGLYIERDRWLVPSLIGIFKAGGAYVPLDPHFPRERLAVIALDAKIKFIVTTTSLEAEAAALGSGMHLHCADTGAPPNQVPLPSVHPDHTAYVLFTSGSTGKPKGVPIRHDSLANLLLSMMFEPGISRDDRVLALTTFTFDISTLEFFLPLICGAQLLLAGHETSIDNTRLVSLIERENITFVQATPSRWTLLLETGWKGRPGMTFLTGGEALQHSLANALADTGAAVWNMYGPTETTVWSSVYRLRGGESTPGIGKPIANTGFFVLDRHNRILPPGIPGELGISGAGLSPGYLNRPDLTSRQFVTIDDGETRRRIYKTGDLVQQRSSGDFRYFGRNDFQVKIRGFRIELGEIESVMLDFPGIKESVCSVWARTEQDKRIVAYYRAESPMDETALKEHIKKSLPEYMVPGHFMAMNEFPHTTSGKTDRKALPLPAVSGEAKPGKLPATALQEQILAVWQEVLGCDTLGIDENFFDLGGHSVLAVELIRKLNARVGGKWRLRDLFENPTVEGLARLAGSAGSNRMPLLFPASQQGTGTPFFLVAGVYENRYFEDENYSLYEFDFLRYFNNILVLLGNERPVYGLRPRGIYRGERFHKTVEAMAHEYITEIKAIQPNGPYLIGGECLGGLVAHAIACQLRTQGDEVSKLVLLDTFRIRIGNEIIMRSIDIYRDIRRTFRAIVSTIFNPELNRKVLREKVSKARIRLVPITRDDREKRYLERGPRRYANLLMRYRAKRYEGRTLLIINEEWNARHPSLCWDTELCPHLDIRIMPGDHTTRLKLENDALKHSLREGLK